MSSPRRPTFPLSIRQNEPQDVNERSESQVQTMDWREEEERRFAREDTERRQQRFEQRAEIRRQTSARSQRTTLSTATATTSNAHQFNSLLTSPSRAFPGLGQPSEEQLEEERRTFDRNAAATRSEIAQLNERAQASRASLEAQRERCERALANLERARLEAVAVAEQYAQRSREANRGRVATAGQVIYSEPRHAHVLATPRRPLENPLEPVRPRRHRLEGAAEAMFTANRPRVTAGRPISYDAPGTRRREVADRQQQSAQRHRFTIPLAGERFEVPPRQEQQRSTNTNRRNQDQENSEFLITHLQQHIREFEQGERLFPPITPFREANNHFEASQTQQEPVPAFNPPLMSTLQQVVRQQAREDTLAAAGFVLSDGDEEFDRSWPIFRELPETRAQTTEDSFADTRFPTTWDNPEPSSYSAAQPPTGATGLSTMFSEARRGAIANLPPLQLPDRRRYSLDSIEAPSSFENYLTTSPTRTPLPRQELDPQPPSFYGRSSLTFPDSPYSDTTSEYSSSTLEEEEEEEEDTRQSPPPSPIDRTELLSQYQAFVLQYSHTLHRYAISIHQPGLDIGRPLPPTSTLRPIGAHFYTPSLSRHREGIALLQTFIRAWQLQMDTPTFGSERDQERFWAFGELLMREEMREEREAWRGVVELHFGFDFLGYDEEEIGGADSEDMDIEDFDTEGADVEMEGMRWEDEEGRENLFIVRTFLII
ncbi:uncharacterized protein LY89DRAFT_722461 [Mollisia scopiformis]|uniref:Uncharacterized protein n=1 Tax=Mollisia scopiformis TaxID=149040 RepID=A0A194WVU0_MOLSC|nr:uncharacterized protein LY89DRAFT_722461 [Mollisia scopiformis]KUJ12088.1 hypothetical protein LY89DRAFT_722461 [Mollisia scopiformis]